MRLTAEQRGQLQQLGDAEHTLAFDSAEELLARLAPGPALIPHLLFFATPGAVSTPPERRFRARVAELIASSVERASAADLLELDGACRNGLLHRWRDLDVRRFEACLPVASPGRRALVALATCHPSGYVRERALALLSTETSGAELPFLLLRLNDWVPAVQHRALRMVQARVRPDYAAHFVHWLLLLARMRGARRNMLSESLEPAFALVRSAAHLESLFSHPDRRLRKVAFALAAEARVTALSAALRDPDVGIRLWATRTAHQRGLCIDEQAADPCAAIRVWSLRARAEREGVAAVPALTQALFDRGASVRASARFHLARLSPQLRIAELYRQYVEREGPSLEPAIAGLGELGERDDVVAISFQLASPSVRVAKAAVAACGRLALSDCVPELLQALHDARAGVSRAAGRALADTPFAVATLAPLVRSAAHTHTRVNALLLARSLDRWERVLFFLEALANERSEVRSTAHQLLERALNGLTHSSYRLSPPARELRTRIEASLVELEPRLRTQLELLLAG